MLVRQHPIKSLSSDCLSVPLSLRFLKIESLIFSDIVHDDSWPWYLVTDGARLMKNSFGSSNLGQTSQSQAQN